MPTPTAPDTLSFLDTLLAIETAWAELEGEPDLAAARRAAAVGRASAQILLRAAEIVGRHGETDEARGLLEEGLRLDGPPAPLQLAYAAMLDDAGDRAGARTWLIGAMLRSRPDAALGYRLAAIEAEGGMTAIATAVVDAAARLVCNTIDETVAAGRRLRDAGQAALACRVFARAFARGARDWHFLADYGSLVASDASLAAIPDDAAQLSVLATNARLALLNARDESVQAAHLREASAAWVAREDLGTFILERLRRREPFSWVRVGDGEARFLACADPSFPAGITTAEADIIVRHLWHNWFGSDIAEVPAERLRALATRTCQAIAKADLLGVASAGRLIHDRNQAGYCGLLEQHIRTLTDDNRERRFTDALFNYTLNELDPFYARLLKGRDFVGLIGPHPELAERMRDRLAIGEVRSWDIPGEGGLDRDRDKADRGLHFPLVYDRLLSELAVPYRGALFLVAGGLLAKVYCDHIRDLGGIALDIGAVADAWMGYNSRGVVQKLSMQAGVI
ncbi:MAG: hypothetical protein V4618_19880 [Pseudomonadota bacterium]